MINEKGSAVIRVMLCSASNPPAFNKNSAKTANSPPHPAICHLGEIFAFLVAMLFITNIPESAEVTKKIMMIPITIKLINLVNGRYSKNLNIRESGSVASALNAPSATWLSSHMALLPNTDIHIKLKIEGRISTAAINSRMVLPFDILAMNRPTKGDHEIHQAQYRIVQL